MNASEHEPDNENDQSQDNSAVEITDLGLPGEGAANNAYRLSSRWLLSWQRSLSRRRVRLATALGMLLLVAIVVFFSMHLIVPLLAGLPQNVQTSSVHQSLPVDIKPSVSILPQNAGFACVADVAWSKDSRYLAFVGYRKSCTLDNNQYEPGLVGIYNAQSGRLAGHFQPDGVILSALKMRYPQVHGTPVIYYNTILLSLNQQRLALTFSIFYIFQPPAAKISTFYGVLLTNGAGMAEELLLQPQKNNTVAVEWDLAQGVEIDHPVITSDTSLFAETSPSMPAYAWAENGSLLLGAQKLDSSRTANGSIGNPNGDNSFSIWQPGTVELITQVAEGKVYPPGVYAWNSYFAAWSPDERYLIDNVSVPGRFEVAGQPPLTHQEVVDLQMENIPQLPVRDTGLLHILQTLTGAPANLGGQLISWRPDGQTLAQYDAGTVDLDLFDCATGYQVASFLLPINTSAGIVGHTVQLQWSPDGAHLFLFDPQVGSLVLWNIGQTG